jgi:hypothetical protein
MNTQFIYTGPSWAKKSWDPPGSIADKNQTNLAKEWGIPFLDLSQAASSVLDRVKAIKNLTINELPIVWIYNEPIVNLTDITGLSFTEFIQSADWKDIWNECNQHCLQAINNIGKPVLLIGGHSDIVDCNYDNITVGYHSWQKWIAEQAGLQVDHDTVYVKMDDGGDFSFEHCWGAEVVHRSMHNHPNITPSKEITNAIWDIFFFWKELEKANLFFEVHPNKQSNQQFAEFLLPTVTKFLQDNK